MCQQGLTKAKTLDYQEKSCVKAIRWQLKKESPFDAAKAILDYQIIKKTTKEDGSAFYDIICALAQEDQVREMILKLKQLGLKCVGVSLLLS